MTTIPDDTLFDLPEPTPQAPRCPRCPRPARWNPTQQRWHPYCDGKTCSNHRRICKQCGEEYDRSTGGTQFCKPDCRDLWHFTHKRPKPWNECSWCHQTPTATPHKYLGTNICHTCLAPLEKVLHQLRKHHTPTDLLAALAADPTCRICHKDLVTPVQTLNGYRTLLVIDHDHSCCPGARSCGRCIRGFLCHPCNILLGMAQDDPAILLAAGNYLHAACMRVDQNQKPVTP